LINYLGVKGVVAAYDEHEVLEQQADAFLDEDVAVGVKEPNVAGVQPTLRVDVRPGRLKMVY
jgi:hypothetical protein